MRAVLAYAVAEVVHAIALGAQGKLSKAVAGALLDVDARLGELLAELVVTWEGGWPVVVLVLLEAVVEVCCD